MGVDGWPDFTAGWCPAFARIGEYLEIQFSHKMVVTAVSTQGRYNSGQWATKYVLQASEDGVTWTLSNASLQGNADEQTIVQ